MKHFLLVAFLSLSLWFPVLAEDSLRLPVRVKKLDGWFSTYSVPTEDTTWTFDLQALTTPSKFGKIDFVHPTKDKDRAWYFPYENVFRVTQLQKKDSQVESVRLVNEANHLRTTITLKRYGGGEDWRGFFVFEELDGVILGLFSFEKQKSPDASVKP